MGAASDFRGLPRPSAADKAASILSILGSKSSAPDCGNQLMELFDYQSFHITAKFLKNRNVIVSSWCTKLMHNDADERVNVEAAIREKGRLDTSRISQRPPG